MLNCCFGQCAFASNQSRRCCAGDSHDVVCSISVDANGYNNNEQMKTGYEMVHTLELVCSLSTKLDVLQGYGKALGIVSCSGRKCNYKAGCSVSSLARPGRRADVTVDITFEATITDAAGLNQETVSVSITAEFLSVSISQVIDIDVTITVDIAGIPTTATIRVSVMVVVSAAPTISPTISPTNASAGNDSGQALICIGSVLIGVEHHL